MRMRAIATSVIITFLASGVAAQEIPPIQYYHNSPQMVGGDPPTLVIESGDPIEGVRLTLSQGRSSEEFELGDIRRGQSAQVTFACPLGSHEYEAELEGQWNDDPFTLQFEFEFEITEGLELSIPLDEVDLENNHLALVMNRPADHVDYIITRDDGVAIGEGTVRFDGERAGTHLPVSWTQGDGTVLKITLIAHDVDGFWAEVELIPWSINIPHEEVTFESGNWEIQEAEQPKIDDAYQEVVEAVERYGEFVDIQLYIAGYTDTVGSGTDNQELSEQRARSIAHAFRERGFHAPIYYQGFGESVLAVQTPDNTDQAENRRALYILAAQPPLPSPQIPRSNWRPID